MRSMIGGWTHWAKLWAMAAAMALAPSAARAQMADGAAVSWSTAGAAAWVSAAMAVALLAALIVCFLKLRRSGDEAARLLAEIDRYRNIARVAPGQFILWDGKNEGEQCSPGFATLFGAESSSVGYDDLRTALDAKSVARLDGAMEGLHEHGEAFSLSTERCDEPGSLRLTGERVDDNGTTILWVVDESQAVETVDRLKLEATGLRHLLDALPILIWRRNRDLRIDFVNSAYADAVEINAADDSEPVPEIAARVISKGGRALAERATNTSELQRERHHIVVGGARRAMDINEIPLENGGGLAGFGLDRTELEEMRDELGRHVQGHEGILHNLGTAIAIYGPDHRLSFFNNAFMRLWKLEESWLQSEPTLGEVLEALRERRMLPEYADFPMFKQDQLKLFTSLLDPVEEMMHLPDGKTFRSVVAAHALGGLLFTWEDVTDALALERSYNTLIEVQRETLDHLYEGVGVIGGDGRLKLSNPAFAEMWQFPADSLVGEPHISSLVDRMRELLGESDDWPSEKEELIGLLTDREPQTGRIERTDGAVLDFATVPLPDGAVLLSFLDVTDSNQVERALRERNDALETADRLKSEFIASVSYELRTPLNTIIGFAEILTGQYFGELNVRQMEYSQGVLESSHRLLSLINNILDLASIEAGHMSLELDTIDLKAMLSEVLALMAERAHRKNLTTSLDCPDEVGSIVGDERRLKTVLFNILSNSAKFTPEDGKIMVSVERDGEGVRIVCADTGIGIGETDPRRMFGKFERGTTAEARQSGAGAGLGLSLVKSFIELHGGHVDLDSVPGEGTQVAFWLPRHAVQQDSEQNGEQGTEGRAAEL